MANHKSAIKRHRQSIKRRDANRTVRSSVRTAIKKAEASTPGAKAKELANSAESLMAKAVKKGIFHKATLARKVSRMQKKANAGS
jgi:small subunit ribosomal protein S20